jgi:hypothetical protein
VLDARPPTKCLRLTWKGPLTKAAYPSRVGGGDIVSVLARWRCEVVSAAR